MKEYEGDSERGQKPAMVGASKGEIEREFGFLREEQSEHAGVDDGLDTHKMRVLNRDLPEALTLDHIK